MFLVPEDDGLGGDDVDHGQGGSPEQGPGDGAPACSKKESSHRSLRY